EIGEMLEQKRLHRAKELFEELSTRIDNPPEVQEELEREIEKCERKLKDEGQKKSGRYSLDLNYLDKEYKVFENGEEIKQGKMYRKRTNLIFLLLEEMINRGNIIHWTAGFIIADRWRKNGIKKKPIEQFWRIVSGVNGEVLSDLILDSAKKEGCWSFNPEVEITSSIEKVKRLCKESKDDKLKPQEKVRKLREAISKYYPDSIKAWGLLIKQIYNQIELKDEKEDFLSDGWNACRRRESALDGAIKRIYSEVEAGKRGYVWADAEPYVVEMSRELLEVKKYKKILRAWLDEKDLPPDEAECITVIGMMDEIRASKDLGHKNIDPRCEALLASPLIQNCISSAASILTKRERVKRKKVKGGLTKSQWKKIFDHEHKDIRNALKTELYHLITGRDPVRYEGVQKFKKYMKGSLKGLFITQQKAWHEEESHADINKEYLYRNGINERRLQNLPFDEENPEYQ
ncbi:hypothetical protein KAR91_39290, partial [Candidatus Pacearchaeota archaeon]|nr:hypothetical protein [Candidatus Pacearchaeota archaeon]